VKARGDANATRLERMWAGEFGERYIERNLGGGEQRGRFWGPVLRRHPVKSALEVGSNIGLNLDHVVAAGARATGVDVNASALKRMRERLPDAAAVQSAGRRLPFGDRSFDLVFTAGVLIHQPLETLDEVMREIVRCSRRYVLCVEYYAPEPTEVPYRGEPGSLFKLDFGARYLAAAPEVMLLWREEPPFEFFGDAMTAWMFERA
jgi:pseudaminic acid biosynthesis-associated methylase